MEKSSIFVSLKKYPKPTSRVVVKAELDVRRKLFKKLEYGTIPFFMHPDNAGAQSKNNVNDSASKKITKKLEQAAIAQATEKSLKLHREQIERKKRLEK